MYEITDSRVLKEKVITFLTYEMTYLNSKYPHSGDSQKKLKPNKWLKSANVVLKSIGNYFQIPYLDIIHEVIKLCSIIRD